MGSPVSSGVSHEAVLADDPAPEAVASLAEVSDGCFPEEKGNLAEDCDECSRGVTSQVRMVRVDEALKETS
jgi:hypothetical protein